MTGEIHLGHCLCNEVRYRISGDVRNLCYCHCESCRRATGSVFVAWGTVDRIDFQISHGELSVINSSKDVERGFCKTCGSTLTYRHILRDDEIDFTLASLADSSALAPQAHIWVQDKLPWVRIADTLPQHQKVAKDG